MLITHCRAKEAIVLNGVIRIIIIAVENGRVKIGIDAPPSIIVVREELLDEWYQQSAPLPPRDPKPDN